MIIERTGPHRLSVLAPAKLNLFLEVLGKRPDGYHELDMVMHSIDLYDRIDLHLKGKTLSLRSTGRAMGPPEDNLALRAARLLEERLGLKLGLSIDIEKKIPVGAGLGGGSSDGAAVLLGANELLGKPLGREALCAVGEKLGSDVPFFFYCGTARCQGRGERITPLSSVAPMTFIVLYPGYSMSTREVYQNLNLDLTKPKNGSSLLEALLKPERPDSINECLFNRLEGAVVKSKPEAALVWEIVRTIGFSSMRVTGTGSSFFQLTDKNKFIKFKSVLTGTDPRWDVFLVKSSPAVRT